MSPSSEGWGATGSHMTVEVDSLRTLLQALRKLLSLPSSASSRSMSNMISSSSCRSWTQSRTPFKHSEESVVGTKLARVAGRQGGRQVACLLVGAGGWAVSAGRGSLEVGGQLLARLHHGKARGRREQVGGRVSQLMDGARRCATPSGRLVLGCQQDRVKSSTTTTTTKTTKTTKTTTTTTPTTTTTTATTAPAEVEHRIVQPAPMANTVKRTFSQIGCSARESWEEGRSEYRVGWCTHTYCYSTLMCFDGHHHHHGALTARRCG